MISKEKIKEIIISNKDFILNKIKFLVKRDNIIFPSSNKVVIFYGARRSGKTFILYHLFKTYKNEALYIDFEDDRLTEFTVADFDKLEEAFLELNPHLINKEKFFLFDELQNIVGWEKYCRRAVEKRGIKIFVTGSSFKIMPFEMHTSLRGRAWSIEVTPFLFTEFLKLNNINIDDNIIYNEKKIIVKNYFDQYIKFGGYPEVLLSKSEFEKIKIIKEYLSSIFFKDLVEKYKITNISLLQALMNKILTSFSQKFSLSAFYKQFKEKIPFSKDSLFKYYEYFKQSMIISETKKYSKSSYQKIRNPSKIYLIDVGIAKLVTAEEYGRILENIVYNEIKKKNENIFYFENINECDFVIENDKMVSVYQVCYDINKNNREREFNALIECCKKLNLEKGTILTYDMEEDFKIDGIEVNIIPVWKWILKNHMENR